MIPLKWLKHFILDLKERKKKKSCVLFLSKPITSHKIDSAINTQRQITTISRVGWGSRGLYYCYELMISQSKKKYSSNFT